MGKIKPKILTDKCFYLHESFVFSRKIYWFIPLVDEKVNIYTSCNHEKLIYDLKHEEAFLVFDHSMDYVVQSVVDHLLKKYDILKLFEQNEISLDRLIVLSPVLDNIFYQKAGVYDYVSYNKKETEDKKYHHIFFNSLWWPYQRAVIKRHLDLVKLSVKKPTKHFMCLSRRDSLNRRYTNYSLHKNNLFLKGIVSHQRVVENGIVKSKSAHVTETKMLSSRSNFDVKAYLKYGYKKHFLDDITDKGKLASDVKTHINYSTESCFELVTETDIMNSMFITEKTLKPLVCKNPFMVSGSAYTLRFLKNLGFQTFDTLYDESYDDELVFYDRFSIIMENMKKLCCLPLEDCSKKIDSINEITNYNQKHFLQNSWTFDAEKKVQRRINKVLNV